MIKIKRKVVLHGNSTLTISLPSTYVKKFNIKKGDELDVEEQGTILKIKTNKEILRESIYKDVGNLNRFGRACITAAYRDGRNKISLKFNDPSFLETVQEVLSREIIGFEIVKHEDRFCVLKDLSGISEEEFDTALRRSWLLTLDLANDTFNAMKNNDFKSLEKMHLRDRSVNKFTNYCTRIITKRGYKNPEKNGLVYRFVRNLEEIADQYQYLATYCSQVKPKISKDVFAVFKEINLNLKTFYDLFYKTDNNRLNDLFKQTRDTLEKVGKIFDKKEDPMVLHYLFSISERIRKLISTLVEIEL